MRLNKYFMLGLAGLAFAACSNDEDVNLNTLGDRVVKMSISREVVTRAVDAPVNAGFVNSVADATIYFVAGGGNVVGTRLLTNEEITALNSAGNHKTEVTCTKVDASAVRAYVVANTTINNVTLNAASTATLDASTANLTQQNTKRTAADDGIASDATNTAQYTTLRGLSTSDFSKTTKTNENVDPKEVIYEGSVTLAPIVCRLEINGIQSTTIATDAEEAGADDVVAFTVEGIYINNFYTAGTLGGTETDRQDFGSDESKYTNANYQTWSYATDYLNQAATAVSGSSTDYAVTVAANMTWARQLFAGEVPHIVVKLTGVKYGSDDASAHGVIKYLTITSYKDSDKAPLEKVAAGKVYKISEIVFNGNDLTDIPYQTTKTIEATVEIAAWTAENITPEFN